MLLRSVLAATVLALTSCASLAQPCNAPFTLRNSSGLAINEVYFGPSTDPSWGPDRLGEDVLPPGRSVSYVAAGEGDAIDVMVVLENGQNAEIMRVNLCSTREIVATRNGLQAR